jgi:hypothetical protein
VSSSVHCRNSISLKATELRKSTNTALWALVTPLLPGNATGNDDPPHQTPAEKHDRCEDRI